MPKMPPWKPPKNIPKALEDGDGFWEDEWSAESRYFYDMNYRERITIDARVRSGKPRIRDTRISVADVSITSAAV